MVTRNISQAKAELSALIEQVLKGGEVVITRAGKPVARLVPFHGAGGPRRPGSIKGQILIAPDFDSLSGDMAEAFGMKKPQR